VEKYSDQELQLICEYMEDACKVSEQELGKLIKANRARSIDSQTPERSAKPVGRQAAS